MATDVDAYFRKELMERREKLAAAGAAARESGQIARLLQEVDETLERIEDGSFGLCQACHEPVEMERLISDPLTQFCLDHLSAGQQQALQSDLELASQIQAGLLPGREVRFNKWHVAFRYVPAGPVSGDYGDVVPAQDGSFYFMIGDVSGKGVSASMLMVQLHATFRSLIAVNLSLNEMVRRANRLLCESTPSTLFATLVCGRAEENGEVEICNAGHLPLVLLHAGEVTSLEATSVPLGMFCDQDFAATRVRMVKGDSLLLCTDGLAEAWDPSGNEYGMDRLSRFAAEHESNEPPEMLDTILGDVDSFRSGTPAIDDLTAMVLRRTV